MRAVYPRVADSTVSTVTPSTPRNCSAQQQRRAESERRL